MILSTQPPNTATTQGQVVVRALSSITSAQAGAIASVVHASGHACDVQAIDDYNGYLSILIEPTVSCDDQKSFFISGTTQGLELFEAHDDNLTLIDTFADTQTLEIQLTKLFAAKDASCDASPLM